MPPRNKRVAAGAGTGVGGEFGDASAPAASTSASTRARDDAVRHAMAPFVHVVARHPSMGVYPDSVAQFVVLCGAWLVRYVSHLLAPNAQMPEWSRAVLCAAPGSVAGNAHEAYVRWSTQMEARVIGDDRWRQALAYVRNTVPVPHDSDGDDTRCAFCDNRAVSPTVSADDALLRVPECGLPPMCNDHAARCTPLLIGLCLPVCLWRLALSLRVRYQSADLLAYMGPALEQANGFVAIGVALGEVSLGKVPFMVSPMLMDASVISHSLV